MKMCKFAMIAVLLSLLLGTLLYVHATSCFNSGAGFCTAVYTEAYITGSSPDLSRGWAAAWGEYTTILGDECCVGSGYMAVMLCSQYICRGMYGPIDNQYELSFFPAGSYVMSTILVNYCDGATTGVEATLSGFCIK